MNDGYRAWGALKSVLSNRGMGMKAKRCLYEGVIVPTVLYGAEAWGIRSVERRKVNVLEMKCLKSLVGVSRMDIVRKEEVRRRAGIERELARQRLGSMDVVKVALGRQQRDNGRSRAQKDNGGGRAQRDKGGGRATMSER